MSTLEVKAIQAPSGFDLDMPAGHILQTVQSTYSTVTDIRSTSYTATGLSASITPQFSSSKILVITNISVETYQNGEAGIKAFFQVLRDSTAIISRAHDSYAAATSAGGYYSFSTNANFSYLDSPSTTSAVTYSVKARSSATTNNFTIRMQDQGGSGVASPSTITLMEVSA
jgi:hypothetical protein